MAGFDGEFFLDEVDGLVSFDPEGVVGGGRRSDGV